MKSQMKLKYTLVFTIISFFITIAGFAQQYSDEEIGFDVQTSKASLKEYSLTDQQLESEIIFMRDMQTRQYVEMKKTENAILEKIKTQIQQKNNTNRSVAVTDIPQSEKDALLAFYNSTGGDNWLYKKGWDFSTPVTSWNNLTQTGWYGITIGANGNVISLAIGANGLVGTIPPEIGQLTQLTMLAISGNKLLTGSIPHQIGQLSQLTNLYISNNLIDEVPAEIGQLSELTSLTISSNEITSIPIEITQLKKLKRLDLSRNKLLAIPKEIGQLTELNELLMNSNLIKSTIPNEIGFLKKLTFLNLNGNSLTGSIPSEIGQLTELNMLALDFNRLTGSIPNEITLLTKLTYLGCSNNIITGPLPIEIGKLTKLQQLVLYNNRIQGIIPNQLFQLTDLRVLQLSCNSFTGTISPLIGNLSKLYTLSFDCNNFEGTLPIEINSLKELTTLTFAINKLEGDLPDVRNFKLLKDYQFRENKFRFIDFETQYSVLKTQIRIFEYSPQAKTDSKKTFNVPSGTSITLKMCEDNRFTSTDTFQWYKGISPNGQLIQNATAREYTINNITSSDTNTYYCLSKNSEITNPEIVRQNLILEREAITLNVINCTPVTGTLNPTTQNTFTNTDINFSLATTATGLTYEWTFQNVSNSTTFTSSSATYSYATPGSYNVTLVVTDSNGCKTTFTKIMEVAAKPACVAIVGEIKTSSEKIIPNQNVTFSFETAATNFTYNWIFYNQAFVEIGRAATSTASRSYNAPGDYLVALELVDQNGCKTYKGLTVKVVADCPLIEGTIKVNTEHPTLYTTAIFTFETTATNLTYIWTVKIPENGGYYNYEQGGNPFQLYLQYGAGDYKIMLEVKDANECITKFEKIITVAFDCTTVRRDGTMQNVNKHSYGFNPLVLINVPNTFTFYPPVDESETGLWTIKNLNGDVISSSTTTEFITTPTVAGDYKLNYTITNSYGCKTNFSNDIKVVDICGYTDEERYGTINFVNEYSNGAAFIDINQTKNLAFRYYQDQTKTYNYQWKVYDPNNALVDSGNQETFPLTLTTPGFHRITVAILDPETGCQLEFSKSISTVISNSCTDTNPKSQIVKGLYFDLVKNLIARSMMGETDEQINASPANAQFTALIPYITNGVKDKIYNYKSVRDDNKNEETNSLRSIDFSFSPDRVSDVRVYFKWGMYYDPQYDSYEDLLATIEDKIYFSLTQYTSPDVPLISCYVDNGGKIKGSNPVKPGLDECSRETIAQYIDFCPAEDCKPIIGVLKSTDTAGISKGSNKSKAKLVSKK